MTHLWSGPLTGMIWSRLTGGADDDTYLYGACRTSDGARSSGDWRENDEGAGFAVGIVRKACSGWILVLLEDDVAFHRSLNSIGHSQETGVSGTRRGREMRGLGRLAESFWAGGRGLLPMDPTTPGEAGEQQVCRRRGQGVRVRDLVR